MVLAGSRPVSDRLVSVRKKVSFPGASLERYVAVLVLADCLTQHGSLADHPTQTGQLSGAVYKLAVRTVLPARCIMMGAPT